jgi:endoglucanase
VFSTITTRLVSTAKIVCNHDVQRLTRLTDDFVFNAWGKTTWGSDADKAALEADLSAVRGNFTDIPLIIGEWDVSSVPAETAARWRYFDFFLRTAAKYNTSTVLWDNGADHLNRATHRWRDTVAIDIYRNAVKGIPNALPDSTTDGSTTQQSSAFIYHKQNATVTNTTLPFFFNGNTLSRINFGRGNLKKGQDYTISGEKITFSAALLSTILTPDSPTGSLANFTLRFDRGAALLVNVLQYRTPVISQTKFALPAAGTDLLVPVTWTGQNRPAAIKAVKADGTFLVDDWTQWLPALQQGRLTYENHFHWDADHVLIKAGALDAVRAAGQSVTFTIEFWPREPGNNVDIVVG